MLAEAILSGPDYFYCEHYRARISKACCVERQAMAEKGIPSFYSTGGWTVRYEGCAECAQGKKIREGLKMPNKKGKCANCERIDVTIMAHGLCSACYPYRNEKAGLEAAKLRLQGRKIRRSEPAPKAPPPVEPTPERDAVCEFMALLTAIGNRMNKIPGVKVRMTVEIG